MIEHLKECRICGSSDLWYVLNLGNQVLTGVFPASVEENAGLTQGPLRLVRCNNPECNLVQLDCTYDLKAMYGMNYGYRSGLNAGMVAHLQEIAVALKPYVQENTVVLDIGSNDGTLLNAFSSRAYLIGFDPTIKKFSSYYHPDIVQVPEFFSAKRFYEVFTPGFKVKVVTSIAMFYDLPKPQEFVNDIASILARDGVWYFEQSYCPKMVQQLAYDTVCHEHLEYYGLKQVRYMLRRAGLAIQNVTFNDTNGASFAVTAGFGKEHPLVATICDLEDQAMPMDTWIAFDARVKNHREMLREAVKHHRGFFGRGASTKGNVLLQYCGFTTSDIPFIAEVNPDKFGKFTPGSMIPIISEEEAVRREAPGFVVLPWHFREGFLKRRVMGDKPMLFPLPRVELV